MNSKIQIGILVVFTLLLIILLGVVMAGGLEVKTGNGLCMLLVFFLSVLSGVFIENNYDKCKNCLKEKNVESEDKNEK
jgi:membrane protein CcdC involved in cytochrome C biogenesis